MAMLEDLLKIDYTLTSGWLNEMMDGWVIETICSRCCRLMTRDPKEYMQMCAVIDSPMDRSELMEIAKDAIGFVKMCNPEFAPMCVIRTWFDDNTNVIPIVMEVNKQRIMAAKVDTKPIKNFFL
jgi:hypothetical protein